LLLFLLAPPSDEEKAANFRMEFTMSISDSAAPQASVGGMPTASNIFGILAPGRPVQTEFFQTDPSKFMLIIQNPNEITDLVFFLLPNCPLPDGFGAVLYFSLDGTNWDLLGAVTPNKPSGVFRTGWPSNEQVTSSSTVQLGVSVEQLDIIENLGIDKSGVEERKQFAYKIAVDLFNFMGSFNQSPGGGSTMVVPTTILDQWMHRFEQKYARDPNFMMKNNI